MKSSFCIDLLRFMLIPTKFPLSHILTTPLASGIPLVTIKPYRVRINKKEDSLTSAAISKSSGCLHVVPLGLEPSQTEPKPVVLPLHHGTVSLHAVRLLEGCVSVLKFRVQSYFFSVIFPNFRAKTLLHGDEEVVFLSALCEEVLSVYEVF